MSDEKVFATKVKGKTMECMTRQRRDSQGEYTELNFKPVGKKSYSYNEPIKREGTKFVREIPPPATPEPICWAPNRSCTGFMEHRPYPLDCGRIICARCGHTLKKATLWQKFKHWARGIKWAYFF